MAEHDKDQPDPSPGESAAGEQPTEQGAASPDATAPVDQALNAAQQSLDAIGQAIEDQPDPAAQPSSQSVVGQGIDLLSDVELDVMIELGRTEMLVEDVLKLGTGSVVELDKLAGDPVDVHVNGRLVARGEVLVLNDNFCIRISEIVANLEEEAEAAAHAQKTARPVRKSNGQEEEQPAATDGGAEAEKSAASDQKNG